ncbi:MAG TPA: hypothetical protein VJW20_20435 [Candidatus Angelobacter sp.]|nr:hypothetical protein [Candidatus Angelobacter sp.]
MTESVQLSFSGMTAESDPSIYARNVMLGRCGPWPPTRLQCELIKQLLLHQGAQNAISLRDLMGKLQRVNPAPNERQIKEAVHSLVVDFKVRIGASRSEPAGYFLITSIDEARKAARPYIAEIRELAKRVRVLLDPHDLAELAGQPWIEALLNEPEPPKEAV